MSTLITGGTIVTASDTARADLYIEDDTITLIGANLDQPADEVIDATGMYVMPGAIDMHTHLSMPFGGTITADDFESGTKAAAAGGTTTVIDFAIQPNGASLAETLDIWHEKAAGKAVIDYGFHIAVTDLTDAVLAEVPAIVAGGVPSIKCFMAYKGALMVDDGTLLRLLQTAQESGGLVMVHAENGDAIDVLTRQL
ncbi:MAG: dihydropyrimidinase, partial [Thermomicrobiales bacterium]|nr:dihydropyrimidinase [Thermomicrobiales bacterium]